MIICIEYWKGDILLSGKRISKQELGVQIRAVENIYDRNEDNFTPLLCRMFGWKLMECSNSVTPDYTYDRDTHLIF